MSSALLSPHDIPLCHNSNVMVAGALYNGASHLYRCLLLCPCIPVLLSSAHHPNLNLKADVGQPRHEAALKRCALEVARGLCLTRVLDNVGDGGNHVIVFCA